MQYRQRAQYSSDTALLGFPNPAKTGPLDIVKFCSVDTMFHLFLRRSPYDGDDDFRNIARRVHQAVYDYNRNHPGVACDLRSSLKHPGQKECLMSVWFPGDIDLEDMVCVINSIPELKSSGWLRGSVDQLKEEAGLISEDLPFLNRYFNKHSSGGFCETDPLVPWFKAGWLSGKGGTLYFHQKTPQPVIDHIAKTMQAAGSSVSFMHDTHRPWVRPSCLSLRFYWQETKSTCYKTFDTVQACLEQIPDVIQKEPRPY